MMPLTKRLCTVALCLCVLSLGASAQSYPSKPLRMVVPHPAGAATDSHSRGFAQALNQALGQPVIVDNKPGAGGNIAAELVAKAPADGYTVFYNTSAIVIGPALYGKVNYDTLNDFAPVALTASVPLVLVVNPQLPARSVKDFIELARSKPGQLNYSSSGTGTITHVAGELFKLAAEIPMLHVPYRGEAPAITDMIAGQVQVMFANLPPALEHVRAGRLHALAVTTAQRSPVLPEVSAMTEYLPGYEASGWQGLGAPVGTEDPIVQQLSREVQSALGENAMHDRLAALGVDPLLLPKNEFDRFVTAETEKWAKVVRSARIKPD